MAPPVSWPSPAQPRPKDRIVIGGAQHTSETVVTSSHLGMKKAGEFTSHLGLRLRRHVWSFVHLALWMLFLAWIVASAVLHVGRLLFLSRGDVTFDGFCDISLLRDVGESWPGWASQLRLAGARLTVACSQPLFPTIGSLVYAMAAALYECLVQIFLRVVVPFLDVIATDAVGFAYCAGCRWNGTLCEEIFKSSMPGPAR